LEACRDFAKGDETVLAAACADCPRRHGDKDVLSRIHGAFEAEKSGRAESSSYISMRCINVIDLLQPRTSRREGDHQAGVTLVWLASHIAIWPRPDAQGG